MCCSCRCSATRWLGPALALAVGIAALLSFVVVVSATMGLKHEIPKDWSLGTRFGTFGVAIIASSLFIIGGTSGLLVYQYATRKSLPYLGTWVIILVGVVCWIGGLIYLCVFAAGRKITSPFGDEPPPMHAVTIVAPVAGAITLCLLCALIPASILWWKGYKMLREEELAEASSSVGPAAPSAKVQSAKSGVQRRWIGPVLTLAVGVVALLILVIVYAIKKRSSEFFTWTDGRKFGTFGVPMIASSLFIIAGVIGIVMFVRRRSFPYNVGWLLVPMGVVVWIGGVIYLCVYFALIIGCWDENAPTGCMKMVAIAGPAGICITFCLLCVLVPASVLWRKSYEKLRDEELNEECHQQPGSTELHAPSLTTATVTNGNAPPSSV